MKRSDLYLAGAAIAAALILFVLMRLLNGSGDRVTVSVDGAVFGSYPLDEDREILIEGADGGINKLVIKNGRADITEADCPDKLCVRQAAISRAGETIVCLPHRVVVTVNSDGEEGDDALIN